MAPGVPPTLSSSAASPAITFASPATTPVSDLMQDRAQALLQLATEHLPPIINHEQGLSSAAQATAIESIAALVQKARAELTVDQENGRVAGLIEYVDGRLEQATGNWMSAVIHFERSRRQLGEREYHDLLVSWPLHKGNAPS